MITVCDICGCYADRLCACARGCRHHPIIVTVPDRVRRMVVEAVSGNPNHGRGEVGESLAAKLAATSNRQRVCLTTAERLMLIEEADTLYVVAADDASWDSDAKNDRQAARVCLRKLGAEGS